MAGEVFSGARLRLVRVFNGLSPADLGARAGISRQYVHSLEIGDRSPSAEIVNVIAFLLHVTPPFFYRLSDAKIAIEDCHFRKLKSAPAFAWQESMARGALFDQLVSMLDKVLHLPPVSLRRIEARSETEIESASLECRKLWSLGEGPISSMCRVIEQRVGAVITHFRGVSEKVDAFSISRPRPIIVRNTAKESIGRMRFDLAHELGHLVLHGGIQTGDELTEGQANLFASAFLLPRRPFLSEYPRSFPLNWDALYKMKLRWKVSVAALLRRAYQLSVLDPAQYRIANIQLAKRGEKKREKYDEEIPREEPEWLGAALKRYEALPGKSLSELADQLYVTPLFLRRLAGIEVVTGAEWENDPSIVKLANYRQDRQAKAAND